jgi:galactofuranosylgalactofuranosylrhamnosyl-N-acetylglucosaminyl-diphospho-decaprenol beta-1,5/1,6-galactofuranosyltransferase
VDLTDTTPADWDLLRVRRPITYTGWWGTLLPPGTVSELGLPAPFFLKWDDAEYGLRATARGYRHAVLPGASVHHPSWDAFRTQMSWSARILHRNRLATAAAVGAGPGVIASSFTHQVKHVLAGHHLTALLWDAGARAAAEGPDTWLGTDLDRARTDGQQIVDTYTASRPAPEALPVSARRRHRPYSLPLGALRALVRVLGLERPVRSVLELSADAVSWRSTLGAGAVLVTTADGEPLGVLSATGREDRSLLRRTVATHLRLLCRWPRLRRRYRSALPQVTTAAAWTRMLGLDGRSSRTGGADSIGRDGRTR